MGCPATRIVRVRTPQATACDWVGHRVHGPSRWAESEPEPIVLPIDETVMRRLRLTCVATPRRFPPCALLRGRGPGTRRHAGSRALGPSHTCARVAHHCLRSAAGTLVAVAAGFPVSQALHRVPRKTAWKAASSLSCNAPSELTYQAGASVTVAWTGTVSSRGGAARHIGSAIVMGASIRTRPRSRPYTMSSTGTVRRTAPRPAAARSRGAPTPPAACPRAGPDASPGGRSTTRSRPGRRRRPASIPAGPIAESGLVRQGVHQPRLSPGSTPSSRPAPLP